MYIHQSKCISPQRTFENVELDALEPAIENKLKAIEPTYVGIPLGTLRRMGKAVRMGVGAALPLLDKLPMPDGIVIGTGNGGMEDCIKFLNQLIQYNEGTLTPTNFVQSTPNAIAAQIGLMNQNLGYNCTHVHRGLAFENALLDVWMRLKEFPHHNYLVGGLDEISDYNFAIEYLGNWYKKEAIVGNQLFETNTPGSIAGEGASVFRCSAEPTNALAKLLGIKTIHSTDPLEVKKQLELFLEEHFSVPKQPCVLLSGENGDNRFDELMGAIKSAVPLSTTITRFKQLCGEYPTSSSFALWLACGLIQDHKLLKMLYGTQPAERKGVNSVLIYNHFKGLQHSFLLLERP